MVPKRETVNSVAWLAVSTASDEIPQMRSRVTLAVGMAGALYVVLGLRLWWRVTCSPGDDNPLGVIGLVGALLALVPAYGIVLWAKREALRRHVGWLAVSLVAGALLIVGSVLLP